LVVTDGASCPTAVLRVSSVNTQTRKSDSNGTTSRKVVSPDINTPRVEEIIQKDRRVTAREIASELNLSYGSVQRIVTDELRYSKVCARWVPRALSAEHKATRMMCSLTFLQRYHSDGQYFIDRIVTGDETWLHHFTPHNPKEPRWSGNTLDHRRGGRSLSHTPSASKVMATVFWNTTGVILIEYLEHGHTIKADRYCATLTKLRKAIRRKRLGLLSKGVILLHDNAKAPYSSPDSGIAAKVQVGGSGISPHTAPIWLQVDYFIFLALKRYLSGTRFTSDYAVKTAAEKWLNEQGPDYYQDEINKSVERSDKCLNRFGEYVEK
ncbi:histone-lysine N-methyltransferase SETMAR-like, partial [Stegodyphus dumicola]|uniref:histone-lysine N-methyltransferase SETMAR-like n=1 Tax=Stegodyphus dumicola TaxID=202533 RepID=UPI0015A9E9D7